MSTPFGADTQKTAQDFNATLCKLCTTFNFSTCHRVLWDLGHKT